MKSVKCNLEKMFTELYSDRNIRHMSNTECIIAYYESVCGIEPHRTAMNTFLGLVENKKIPTTETITRCFRKLREEHPEWRKPEKIKQLQQEAMMESIKAV